MIDWILAERIAGYVAGTGDAKLPTIDLGPLAAQAEERVVAYTGLRPARPLPQPEGISRKEWVKTNIDSMRMLLDPVMQRAAKGMGPLRPAIQIGVGFMLSTEVGVVVGYLAQRVLGQYELVLLDEAVEDRPPRLLFVLPNLGHAVQAFGAEEKQFMTWVTLHEVTHAVQFSGVPWLHAHVAGLVRELLQTAEVRIETPRKLRMPSGEELRRVVSALREGDLISIVTSSGGARDARSCAGGDGHDRGTCGARDGCCGARPAAVAAEAPRGARPPAPLAVGHVAPGCAIARTRPQAAPVRAGQVLLRRDRALGGHAGAGARVQRTGGAADARRAQAAERVARANGALGPLVGPASAFQRVETPLVARRGASARRDRRTSAQSRRPGP